MFERYLIMALNGETESYPRVLTGIESDGNPLTLFVAHHVAMLA